MHGSSSIAGTEGLNMLKEMGNQNTSGIVEKEQLVGCSDYLENEIKNQQNFDAKAIESDCCGAEVQKTPHMERVAHDEKDLSNVSPVNITSNPQEMRTSSHCEEKCDTKLLVQNRVLSVDSSINDLVVANREDGSVETETPSVEGYTIEMSTQQENCDPSRNIENTENDIRNEKGVEDHPKVEMGSSLSAPDDLRTVSEDTSALGCEVKDECLVLGEMLTANKLSNRANTFHVDQTRAEEEVQGTNDVDQMVKETGLVETKGSVRVDENREEEKLTDEMMIEEIGTIGNKSSALCKDSEAETSTEECSSEVVSSLEIKKVNEPEPGNLFPVQYSNNETTTQQVLQSNGLESTEEKFGAKSESSLEIKKLNQLEPELGLVLPGQYTNNETSRLLVSEASGGEITVERCGLQSESSLEIKKVDEPFLLPELELELELEPDYAFPKQYSIDITSSIQVPEPNRRENIVESCKLTLESSSEIKKVDELETGHSLPKRNSTDETSTVQVPERNGGENTMEKCRSRCESSSEIKKVSEPEPEIEPRHVFSEWYPEIEKSTMQVLGPNGPDRTLENCRSQSESSFEIRKLNESELASKSESKPKAEPDSKQVLAEQYSSNETSTPQVPESKESETMEKLSTESHPNHPINQLELRKSPSFEVGLPFDSRSEESDQGPLLYQESTAPRLFSSCSSYLSPLHCEAVEVEEKTIRMERSTSDVSRSSFLNLSKEEKPENLAVDKDQENGLKSSLSTEDCDGISTKRNGKRKQRSSLFTTCICCSTPSAFC